MEHSCGRDVVRTASKSDKKPPTTCSPGDAIDATPVKTNRRRLQYLMVRIFRISSSLYGVVEMIINLSSKSSGRPWGDLYCVPRIFAMPRFVAVIKTGDRSLSSARFSHEKHSMSSMWTSSTKSTPGTMVARPSSRHSATFASICSRTCAARPELAPNSTKKPPTAFSPGDESRRRREGASTLQNAELAPRA